MKVVGSWPHSEEVGMFAHKQDRSVANLLSQQYSNDITRAAAQHRLARTVRATENLSPQRPCAKGLRTQWHAAPSEPPFDEGAQTPPAQAGKSRDTRK